MAITSCLVGPVPFKDVNKDDDHTISPPLEYADILECVPFMDDLFSAGQEGKLDALPSPRLLHTHMHHSMLPPSLADNPDCKIIYVCREPKDMLVSLWHFIRSSAGDSTVPFSDVFELGCEGKNANGPIWDHILGYWSASKATPGRVLFLMYEKMLADPVSTVHELARFLGVPFTAAEEAVGLPSDIARLCSIDTMRGLQGNTTGNAGLFFRIPHQAFFRKGVAGDWVNHMTPEMARRIDAIVEDKLRGRASPSPPDETLYHFEKSRMDASGPVYISIHFISVGLVLITI